LSIVVAAYAKVCLTPLDSHALPLELFARPYPFNGYIKRENRDAPHPGPDFSNGIGKRNVCSGKTDIPADY
jgi:hypothetical protein